MHPKNILILFIVFCVVNAADAEVKIDSVSQTVGVMGKNMEVTLTGEGFDENTKVSMYIDSGNRKAIIGSVSTPGSAQDVKVIDGKAYVADGESGLQIIDVSNPKNPKIIGTADTTGWAFSVSVSGNYAYVVDTYGLQIIDVSNPESPKIIGSVEVSGWGEWGENVEISGDKAFWTWSGFPSGLQIIDISDPKNAKIIGTAATHGFANSVSVSGDKAFVADGYSGLQIIDISDPKNLTIIGTADTDGFANGVSVSGDKAFVADGYSGLQIVDISDPKVPKIIGSVNIQNYALNVTISGNKAFVTDDYTGLQIIDISDPKNSRIVGSVDMPDSAWSVAVIGDKAYVANGNSGLQIIDVGSPKSNQRVTVNTDVNPHGIILQKDMMCILGLERPQIAHERLQIAHVDEDSRSFFFIRNLVLPGTFFIGNGFTLTENKLYVADRNHGLYIIDVKEQSYPQILGSIFWGKFCEGIVCAISLSDSDLTTYDITIIENKAYVAAGDSGLQIIDISDPQNPQIIRTVKIPYRVNAVTVKEDKAYVIAEHTLQIIDIADYNNPQISGSVDMEEDAQDIVISGNTAYIADGNRGLQIIDVSDSKLPKLIGSVDTLDFALNIALNGGNSYVADRRGGIIVIDISNPNKPQTIGSLDTPGAAQSVAVKWDKAFVADGYAGLTIIPLPVEINSVALRNDKQVSLILPAPEKEGDYSLRIYNNNGNVELPGAVEFVQPENAGILKSKAIIVAGGGNSTNNNIWEETRKYADLAYKALRYQGYTEDNILYLSSEYTDNVNMDALKKNLQYAIQQWAAKNNPPDLLIYFVGHGIENQFILNSAYNEKITADELNNWLNNLQQSLNIRVTFIYDACQSGSFISKLKPPQGKERIIITSASADEPAYFTGETAFSYLFWSTVYGKTARRVDLYSAFNFAQERIGKSQTPMIEANGNDIHNEQADKEKLQTDIGRNYYDFNTKIPKITEASAIMQTATAGVITASVSAEGIDSVKVWAEITAPDQTPPPPDTAVTDVPRIGLTDIGEGRFSLSYDKFDVNGTYTIAVYAINTDNNIPSAPKYLSVTQTQGKDLSAPDLYESDDNMLQAKRIVINGIYPQQHNFHKPGDEDWVKFNGISKAVYTVKVSNKSLFCDPKIEVFLSDGVSKLDCTQSQDDNRSVSCTIPADGVYYVKLSNTKPEIFGAAIRYDLQVYQPSAGAFHGYFTGTLLNNFGSPIAGAGIVTNGGGSDVTDQYGHFTIVQKAGTFTVTPFAPGYASVSYPNQVIREDQTSDITLKLEAGNCLDPPTAKIVSPSSTTIIDKGQSVNFQGTVTGGKSPYQYLWYFGGAPNSDKQNPGDVVFDKPDNPDDVNIFYPVLYVKDADGCVGKSASVKVKVNYVEPQPEEDSGGGGCFIRSVF